MRAGAAVMLNIVRAVANWKMVLFQRVTTLFMTDQCGLAGRMIGVPSYTTEVHTQSNCGEQKCADK